MTLTELLLATHVVGAFALAGSLAVSLSALALTDGHGSAVGRLVAVADPAGSLGTLLLLASGTWMAFDLGVASRSWLIVSLVLFFGLAAIERALIGPRIAGRGSSRAAAAGAGLMIGGVLAIAVLMVLKPAAPVSLLVAAGMLLAGALVALVGSRRRTG